jgi:hypothetical protein
MGGVTVETPCPPPFAHGRVAGSGSETLDAQDLAAGPNPQEDAPSPAFWVMDWVIVRVRMGRMPRKLLLCNSQRTSDRRPV